MERLGTNSPQAIADLPSIADQLLKINSKLAKVINSDISKEDASIIKQIIRHIAKSIDMIDLFI